MALVLTYTPRLAVLVLVRVLPTLVFLCLSAPDAVAQNVGPASPDHDRGWVAFGLGKGSANHISAGVSLNYGREYFGQLAFNKSTDGVGKTGTSTISLGAGYSIVDRIGRIAMSAGPAYNRGRGSVQDQWTNGVGVVVNGQLIFTPVKEVGVGLDLFADLNTYSRNVGARLTFVFEGNK